MRNILILAAVLFVVSKSFSGKIVVPIDVEEIQNACNEVKTGDTVYVLSGTYRENITMPDGIVLLGEKAKKTVIKGRSFKPVIKASNNSLMKNFTIKGGSKGILSENTNMRIEHNIITSNHKSGIHCLISLPLIRNNIITSNKWTGVFCELVTRIGSGAAIEHNIIADNGKSGIQLARKTRVVVKNNIFLRNREFGIFVSANSKASKIKYNNFFENRRAFNQFAVADETNMSRDPELPPKLLTSFILPPSYKSPLHNLGMDGLPVGICPEERLRQYKEDADQDGIPDNQDECKNEPEDMDGFEDEDGCPDYDNDSDGIYDSHDSCPDKPEDFDGFQDEDGCPDPDNDNDGIPDADDDCPLKPESVNGYKDSDGCPDEAPEE